MRGGVGGGVLVWVLLSPLAMAIGKAELYTHHTNDGWQHRDTTHDTHTAELLYVLVSPGLPLTVSVWGLTAESVGVWCCRGVPWWLWLVAVLVLFMWRAVCGSLGYVKPPPYHVLPPFL